MFTSWTDQFYAARRSRTQSGIYIATPTMTATTIALLLALLLLPLLVLLWATESTEQRARRLRSYGWTQRRIADHMGISRSRVQRIVTA